MKKIKLFYLKNCPHCKRAFKMIEQLQEANPEYKKIEFELIEESKNWQLANSYDYYYVPTFYIDDKKMFEGVPKIDKIEEVLKAALNNS